MLGRRFNFRLNIILQFPDFLPNLSHYIMLCSLKTCESNKK